MIPYPEVQARVLDVVATRVGTLPAVDRALADVAGLVTAEEVVADSPVPRFANSAMDGFAVVAADTAAAASDAPVALRVIGVIAAGADPSMVVGPGEAVAIMTGAPMPAGADAVMMVEMTTRAGDDVLVEAAVEIGTHVRYPGEDMQPGDVLVPAASVMRATTIGVLANAGRARVVVHRRARVGVMTTGDELVPLDVEPPPGKIRDSNRPMLLALARESGFDAVDLGSVVDDEEKLAHAIVAAGSECDALVMTGGVSVGTYDYVAAALGSIGTVEPFKVAIKPAKPFALGIAETGGDRPLPVFGLPGNPVSCYVSFELFARPAILRMMGRADAFRPVVRAECATSLRRHPDGKVHFVRAAVTVEDGRFRVSTAGGQQSHMLSVLGRANALALVPDGNGLDAGDPVDVVLLGSEL